MAQKQQTRPLLDSNTGLPIGNIEVTGNRKTFIPTEEQRRRADSFGLTQYPVSIPIFNKEPEPIDVKEEPSLVDKIFNWMRDSDKKRDNTILDLKKKQQEAKSNPKLQATLKGQIINPDKIYSVDNQNLTMGQIQAGMLADLLFVSDDGKVTLKGKKTPFAQIDTEGNVAPITYRDVRKNTTDIFKMLGAENPIEKVKKNVAQGVSNIIGTSPQLNKSILDALTPPIPGVTQPIPTFSPLSQAQVDATTDDKFEAAVAGFSNLGMFKQPEEYNPQTANYHMGGSFLGSVAAALGTGGAAGALGAGRLTAGAATAIPSLLNTGEEVLSGEITPEFGAIQGAADVASNMIGMKYIPEATMGQTAKSIKDALQKSANIVKTSFGDLVSFKPSVGLAASTGIAVVGTTPVIIQKQNGASSNDLLTAAIYNGAITSAAMVAFHGANLNTLFKRNRALAEAVSDDINNITKKINQELSNNPDVPFDDIANNVIEQVRASSRYANSLGDLNDKQRAKFVDNYISNLKKGYSKNPNKIDLQSEMMLNPDGSITLREAAKKANVMQEGVPLNQKAAPEVVTPEAQPMGITDDEIKQVMYAVDNSPVKTDKETAKNLVENGYMSKSKTGVNVDTQRLNDLVASYIGKPINEINIAEYKNAIKSIFNMSIPHSSRPKHMPLEDKFNSPFLQMQATDRVGKASSVMDYDGGIAAYNADKVVSQAEIGILYDTLMDAMQTIAQSNNIAMPKINKQTLMGNRTQFIKKHTGKTPDEIRAELNQSATIQAKRPIDIESLFEEAQAALEQQKQAIIRSDAESSIYEDLLNNIENTPKTPAPEEKITEAKKMLEATTNTSMESAVAKGSGSGVIENAALVNQAFKIIDAEGMSPLEKKMHLLSRAKSIRFIGRDLPEDEKLFAEMQASAIDKIAQEIAVGYDLQTVDKASVASLRLYANQLTEMLDKEILADLNHARNLYQEVVDMMKKENDPAVKSELLNRAKIIFEFSKQRSIDTQPDNVDLYKDKFRDIYNDVDELKDKIRRSKLTPEELKYEDDLLAGAVTIERKAVAGPTENAAIIKQDMLIEDAMKNGLITSDDIPLLYNKIFEIHKPYINSLLYRYDIPGVPKYRQWANTLHHNDFLPIFGEYISDKAFSRMKVDPNNPYIARAGKFLKDIGYLTDKTPKQSPINNIELRDNIATMALGIGALAGTESEDENVASLSTQALLGLAGVMATAGIVSKTLQQHRNKQAMQRGTREGYRNAVESVLDDLGLPEKKAVAKQEELLAASQYVNRGNRAVQIYDKLPIDDESKSAIKNKINGNNIKVVNDLNKVVRSVFGKPNHIVAVRELAMREKGTISGDDLKIVQPLLQGGQVKVGLLDVSPTAFERVKNEAREIGNENGAKVMKAYYETLQQAGSPETYGVTYAANLRIYAENVEANLMFREGLIDEETLQGIIAKNNSPESLRFHLEQAIEQVLGDKAPPNSTKFIKTMQDAENAWDSFRNMQMKITEAELDADCVSKTGLTLSQLRNQRLDIEQKAEALKEKIQMIKDSGNFTSEEAHYLNLELHKDKVKLDILNNAEEALATSANMQHVSGYNLFRNSDQIIRVHEMQLTENGYVRRGEAGQVRRVTYYNNKADRDADYINILETSNAEPIEGTDLFMIDATDIHGKVKVDEQGNPIRVPVQIVQNDMNTIKKLSAKKIAAIEELISELSGTEAFKRERRQKGEALNKQLEEYINSTIDKDTEEYARLLEIYQLSKQLKGDILPGEAQDVYRQMLEISRLGNTRNFYTPSHNFYGGMRSLTGNKFIKQAEIMPANVTARAGDSMLINKSIQHLSDVNAALDFVGVKPETPIRRHYEAILKNVLRQKEGGKVAKAAQTVSQTLSMATLSLNLASATRNVADAAVMQGVVSSYVHGSGGLLATPKFIAGMLGHVPVSLAKRALRKYNKATRQYEKVAESYGEQIKPEEIKEAADNIDELRRIIANMNNEGISPYLNDTYWKDDVTDAAYVLLRMTDMATRNNISMQGATHWISKNEYNPALHGDYHSYLREAANRGTMLSNAAHGRFQSPDLHATFGYLRQQPLTAWLSPMMMPWANKMSVVNMLISDAVLYNNELALKSLTSLGALAALGTAFGGMYSIPYLHDAMTLASSAYKISDVVTDGSVGITGLDDPITPNYIEGMWLETMESLQKDFKFTQEEALDLKHYFEGGVLSMALGVDVSMNDEIGMPFVISKLQRAAEAAKNGKYEKMLSEIAMPKFTQNVYNGYMKLANGENVELLSGEVLMNKDYTTQEAIMHMIFGNDIETTTFKKNKFAGKNPIDLPIEREALLKKYVKRVGVTVSGGTKGEEAFSKNKFMNDNVIRIQTRIMNTMESPEFAMILDKAMIRTEKWLQLNEQKLLNKLSKGSEHFSVVNLKTEKEKLRQRVGQYLTNKVIVDEIKTILTAAKGRDKAPNPNTIIFNPKSAVGKTLDEKAFNYAIEGYNK